MIAYNLVIDNKRIQTAKEEDDFKEFFGGNSFSGSPSSLGHSDSSTPRPHPERIAPLRDSKPGGQAVTPVEKTHRGAPIKRSKWHLGIRSQSKPHDIMSEVYRAMKTLDFEWKVINPYHVQVNNTRKVRIGSSCGYLTQVRRKNPCSAKYVKMSLQLYQVDYKSYLLDFKSLVEEESSQAVEVSSSLEKPKVVELQESSITGHHTMEFFEMCAALITQLAR